MRAVRDSGIDLDVTMAYTGSKGATEVIPVYVEAEVRVVSLDVEQCVCDEENCN
jgi:hypothetical protein